MIKPPIMLTSKPLPFGDLSPLEFERLCLWLVEREGWLRPQHLGEAGSEQGRDVVAHKPTDVGEQLWYFQCKRCQRIGAATLKKEVDKYDKLAESDPTRRPSGMVFVTNAVVSARVRDDMAIYCQERGYACDFWAHTELDMRVKKHPEVVREFFDASSKLLERFVREVEQHLEAMAPLSPSFAQDVQPARLFISYKRHTDLDRELALYLHETLQAQGHQVFVDLTARVGDAWLEQIDQQIKASDFLIVLLSRESADSEMVRAEVSRAYEYRKSQGNPLTLPVRIAYEGMFPYSIAAFLNPIQYAVWRNEADNEWVAQEILAAIAGRLPQKPPIVADRGAVISEDGRPLPDGAGEEALHPPLPDFDPRFLRELTVPGGVVRLSDKLYIERRADAQLREQIIKWGSTTTIRAPRQTGKTSLLMRGIHHACERGANIAFLDFQSFGSDRRTSLDDFLLELAESICYELDLDEDVVRQAWRGSQSGPRKLIRFMEKRVLPALDKPLVLAMDEADCLLQTEFYKDFFGLLRSWHNRRAHPSCGETWKKLNIVLVISTESYLLIDDVNQSPFNVGLRLYLEDFDKAQVRDLNQQHCSPVPESDLPQLMALLDGHPYLTRNAFYTLYTNGWAWADLTRVAATDQGPFGDHLRRQYWLLQDEPELREALKTIIHRERCPDEVAIFRLLRAGLVKGSGDVYQCRCGLYKTYFEDKLR